MKDNFFNSMFSESGKISHKRWISVTLSGVLAWVIVYSAMKAANASERLAIIIATMSFILVMAGMATMPQIITLIRGGYPDKEEGNTIDGKKPEDETK